MESDVVKNKNANNLLSTLLVAIQPPRLYLFEHRLQDLTTKKQILS